MNNLIRLFFMLFSNTMLLLGQKKQVVSFFDCFLIFYLEMEKFSLGKAVFAKIVAFRISLLSMILSNGALRHLLEFYGRISLSRKSNDNNGTRLIY